MLSAKNTSRLPVMTKSATMKEATTIAIIESEMKADKESGSRCRGMKLMPGRLRMRAGSRSVFR